jgi:RNA-binding protein
MKRDISNTKRKELKKKSYSLKPIIMIGQNGLTDSVINEIDNALDTHELIKVRTRGSDKDERTQQCLKIKEKLNADIIHRIGFITVLYRPTPESS